MEYVVAIFITIFFVFLVVSVSSKNKENNHEEAQELLENNPITIKSKEFYHYATSKNYYLERIERELRRKVINNNYSFYEDEGLVNEMKERENERVECIVAGNEEQLKNIVENLLENKVRPELIGKALEGYVKNSENKTIIRNRDKFLLKLKRYGNEFDNAYSRIMHDKDESQVKYYNERTEENNDSSSPTGLGFGIISTSVSKTLIYQGMQKREIEKQIEGQKSEYESKVISLTGKEVCKQLENVELIYRKFGNKVIEEISSLFNFETSRIELDNTANQPSSLKHNIRKTLELSINKKVNVIYYDKEKNVKNELSGTLTEVGDYVCRVKIDGKSIAILYEDMLDGYVKVKFESENSNKELSYAMGNKYTDEEMKKINSEVKLLEQNVKSIVEPNINKKIYVIYNNEKNEEKKCSGVITDVFDSAFWVKRDIELPTMSAEPYINLLSGKIELKFENEKSNEELNKIIEKYKSIYNS